MKRHLEADFLLRVRRSYRLALEACGKTRGMWGSIDKRRNDIHAALLAETDEALRAIFTEPASTDLYYGVGGPCRSIPESNASDSSVQNSLLVGRAPHARYQIDRVTDLLGGNSGSVIEIGPGLGLAAFYSQQIGLDYTTIDLPLGIVCQACFLGEALGPDKLWLQGDDDQPDAKRIKIVFSRPDRHFDIALNVDSMTEMPASAALSYLRWLSDHAGLFLSINHHNNSFGVDEVAALCGWHHIARRPAPCWEGYAAGATYIEEIFQCKKTKIPMPRVRKLAFLSRTGVRQAFRRSSRLAHHASSIFFDKV